MNSKVPVKDLDSGKRAVYSLMFPHDASISDNEISILGPLGPALFGYRVGDAIEWRVSAGMRRIRIEELLYQSEAAVHSAVGVKAGSAMTHELAGVMHVVPPKIRLVGL